jgi:hypothetical protein
MEYDPANRPTLSIASTGKILKSGNQINSVLVCIFARFRPLFKAPLANGVAWETRKKGVEMTS